MSLEDDTRGHRCKESDSNHKKSLPQPLIKNLRKIQHFNLLRELQGILMLQNVTHHLTAFLGVKLSNDEACILTPFMSNGNVNAYIQSHPRCDRRVIVSLRLDSLHAPLPYCHLFLEATTNFSWSLVPPLSKCCPRLRTRIQHSC